MNLRGFPAGKGAGEKRDRAIIGSFIFKVIGIGTEDLGLKYYLCSIIPVPLFYIPI